MARRVSNTNRRALQKGRLGLCGSVGFLTMAVFLIACGTLKAQASSSNIADITGRYEFLDPDNTLAILEEGGKLKGYINVLQGEGESDALLSYMITIGSYDKNHVEFKTRKIHEKYYRFSGIVKRGNGHAPRDPDYLRLAGELVTVTDDSVTGHEQVDRKQVVFKSKGASDEGP